MRRPGAARAGGRLLLLLLPRGALLLLGVCNALSLEIKASAKVRAFVGEQVLLKCSFKSSSPITESLLVDWTYRPLAGGQMETIFHYQSIPHPTTVGTFKDRISWVGNIANGDASIAIQSPRLSDNGTFICSVKNPPDVYHNIPQTVLVVTERGLAFQLSSAALLAILVFLPSALVVIVLLVRMRRKFRVLKEKGKCGYKKSSIEVSDEPKGFPQDEKPPVPCGTVRIHSPEEVEECLGRKSKLMLCFSCRPEHSDTAGCGGKLKQCCLNCVDTDEEDPY
uniref:myelin protein zero-like protein 3 n=1 Tax=Lonchura striata TaxID=40157 RepID=UPI000B4CBFD7|nr:myelin protein zero-like protein 3 [Lonchura striata domestica]